MRSIEEKCEKKRNIDEIITDLEYCQLRKFFMDLINATYVDKKMAEDTQMALIALDASSLALNE